MATQSSHIPMIIFFVIALFCFISNSNARLLSEKLTWKRLIIVDQSGKGNYMKIQDAIDAVPSNNVDSTLILVKPGIYKEKLIVPEDKPFIMLSGRNALNTTITWDDSGDIFTSPTLSVFASDFVARYLTIQNTYGPGAKAVALRVTSERADFFACRIISYQDTLLDERGSHFYSNCYIEGGTDFICGNGASLFRKCRIHSVSDQNGAITAQRRMKLEEDTGFYFVDCKVTGIKSCTLGRPWGPHSRVVFIRSYLSNVVNPHGWDDWGKPSTHSSVYYGEYKCYGPGANRSNRVQWSQSLSNEEATTLITKTTISSKIRIKH
ncbi:putative pectinesterase 11 [Beta vulgaris subsp. vulgaris]|uniref:putative pectinesterase 11 n=1 Tax=Beta vulgaris subsp. vulgaris TaxID=3555 RepID=UPI002036B326|nr:putative pectinesterase 11 [Beta vulgaris subsp. vulgaris]